jgi:hypothetical protein
MIASHQMLLALGREEETDGVVTAVLRFVQITELLICIFALAVAVLRTRKSALAGPTTAAVSILLAIWVPLGTAAFIWWIGWVRHREKNVWPER